MSKVLEMMGKTNVTVELLNRQQEREFRSICKKEKDGDPRVILAMRDDTSYRTEKGERVPIYPIYYNFLSYNDRMYIGWAMENGWENSFEISFKTFKKNVRNILGAVK